MNDRRQPTVDREANLLGNINKDVLIIATVACYQLSAVVFML